MTTIVNPTKYAKTYFGQIWYNVQGQPIAQTGHDLRQEADRRIASVTAGVRGQWCFAVVQTMKEELGRPAVWDNAVIFPDGKYRKLKIGELPFEPNKPEAKGIWLTVDAIKAAYPKTRVVQALRFPFERDTLQCRLSKWENMLAFEAWLEPLTTSLFVFDCKGAEPLTEEGLFAYLVVAPH